MIQGIACRDKLLPEVGGGIVGLRLPGDCCDLHLPIPKRMDHGIGALTPCRLVNIPHDTIEDLLEKHPRIRRTLWWASPEDAALRPADDASLLRNKYAINLRLKAFGFLFGRIHPLPHEELGDVPGISNVHAQRVMASLRNDGLISLRGRRIVLPGFERVSAFAQLDPDYLHLDPDPDRLARTRRRETKALLFFGAKDGLRMVCDVTGGYPPDRAAAQRDAISALASVAGDVLPSSSTHAMSITVRDGGRRPIFHASASPVAGWFD